MSRSILWVLLKSRAVPHRRRETKDPPLSVSSRYKRCNSTLKESLVECGKMCTRSFAMKISFVICITIVWCDPVTKKHYKLSPFDMADLVEFAQKGSTLKTHDGSPITCGMHCTEQNDRNRVGGKQARPTDYQEILRMHRYQLHKWQLGLLSRCRRQAWRALLVSRVVVMMQ